METTPTPSSPTNPSSKKLAVITAVSILISLVSLGLAGSLIYKNNRLQESTPANTSSNPLTAPIPTIPPSPTQTQTTNESWKKYIVERLSDLPTWNLPWKGFIIFYPSDWKVLVNKREIFPKSETPSPSQIVNILAPNGDIIEIGQGEGGGGSCIFPDEPDYTTFDGMGFLFQKYTEFKKDNLLWRIAEEQSKLSFRVCEKTDSRFIDTTIVGDITAKASDQNIFQTMKEIINRIEISN